MGELICLKIYESDNLRLFLFILSVSVGLAKLFFRSWLLWNMTNSSQTYKLQENKVICNNI